MTSRADDAREAERLAAVRRYSNLGSEKDERFDRIVRLAATALSVPFAAVSIVDKDRHWFKAAVGTALQHAPRNISFCNETVENAAVTVIADTHLDPRFADNPFVLGPPFVRFYAGAPIMTSSGAAIGSLSIYDDKPRSLDDHARTTLIDLASVVMDEIELHRALDDVRGTERALRTTQVRARRILDQVPGFIAVIDLDGEIAETNATARAWTDFETDEVTRQAFWRTPWWPQSDGTSDPIQQATRAAITGQTTRFDVELRNRSKLLRTVDVSIAPLVDENGTVTDVVASGFDVSDRVALANEHAQLAQVIAKSPLLVMTSSPEGNVLHLNAAARALLGVDGDAPHGHLRDFHPDWVMRIFEETAFQTAATDGAWSGETAIIGADGREIATSHVILAQNTADGRLQHFTSIAVDISEIVSARELVKVSEERFRGTFENAAVGIAHVGLIGRWKRMNERLLEIVGYTRAQLIRKTFQEITYPDDLPYELDRFEELKAGKIERYTLEKRLIRKDGTLVWVQATVSMHRNTGATEPYAILVVEDASERKLHEQRQRLMLAELNHRAGNTLAMIQAVANLSLKQSANPHAFAASFLARLQALARTHELLTQYSWDGVAIDELIRAEVLSDGAIASDRLMLDGGSLLLPPQEALNLALVLHELARNARQHGAHRGRDGRVLVSWTVEGAPGPRLLSITWVEREGPPVVASATHGFGWTLLERGLRQGLGGTYRIRWEESGLVAELRLPLPPEIPRSAYFSV